MVTAQGEGPPGPPRWWKVANGVAIVLVAAFAFWQLWPDSGSGDATVPPVSQNDAATSINSSASRSTSAVASTSTRINATTDALEATTAPDQATTSRATTTDVDRAPSTTVPRSTTTGATSIPTSAASLPAQSDPFGYPASADGTPLPLVVIFDVETITISGQVPSEAARDRLAVLAKANSQFPDAEVVDNMVINPAVPLLGRSPRH